MPSLPIEPGRMLQHFRLLEKIGEEGMGVVWKAMDTTLGREVAIKVLPEALAADTDRLARFEREARLPASLNHPGIATLHGLHESGGVRFLAMELVRGSDLSRRLSKGALLVDEALSVAQQLASALEAAHEKGVIHRDLKPGNVMLDPDGKIKVLDFGLAKALLSQASSGDLSQSPTVAAEATRHGVILGTAAYMSPEQARGKVLDRRTDIWSFGCVLYELLAGRRPFAGESVSDTLAAILTKDPDFSVLPAATPSRVRDLLRRCLQKDPQRRLRDAGDARLEIEEARAEPSRPEVSGARGTRRPMRSLWALAAALAIAAFAAGTRLGAGRVETPPAWSGEMLLGGSTLALSPRISPDGQTLAFQAIVDGLTQVAVMKPGTGDWIVLTHDRSHGTILNMSWSRDGTKIYYDRSNAVYSIPALGGDERLILEGVTTPEALPDGSLLVARIESDRNVQLHHYWPDTARLDPVGPRFLASGPSQQPRAFPDGKEAVILALPLEDAASNPLMGLYAIDLGSGRTRRVAPEVSFAPGSEPYMPLAVMRDGRSILVDLRAGDLHQVAAVPRDGDGPPRVLLTLTTVSWYMDAGPDGSVYLDQCDRAVELLRVAPSGGAPETIARSTGAPSFTMNPIQLPDGRVLLSSVVSGRSKLLVAWPGKDAVPFVETSEETSGPVTLVEEQSVAFFVGAQSRSTLAIATLDGRIVRRFAATKLSGIQSIAASLDGKTLYYADAGAIWAVPVQEGEPRKLREGDGVAVDPATGDLIVQLNEKSGTRLLKLPAVGGQAREISIHGGHGLAPLPISGRIVRADGMIVITLSPSDSWFWGPGVLDPVSGAVSRVPLRFEGDVFPASWGNDGSILAMGWGLQTNLWRFRPAASSEAAR